MGPGATPATIDVGGRATRDVARLLLVDQHLCFRTAIAFILDRELDLQVAAHVGSISDVSALLADRINDFDVALVGLQPPDGAGTDLIQTIHAGLPRCRIVALTGSADRRVLAEAIAAGAIGTLHKSVSIQAIIEAIRRVHRGEQLHPPEEMIALLRLAGQNQAEVHAARAALERLTARERDILLALAEGLSDREIATRLHISINTVAAHMVHVLSKLGVHSRLQAVLFAIKHGVIELR